MDSHDDSSKYLPEVVGFVVVSSLIAYVATLSTHSAWLDAGEFVASAASLGVTHPPGHPLQSIWSSLFTFLPFGTLAFRVALASAAAAALGCGALCALCFRLLGAANLAHPVRLLLSVIASASVALSPSLWAQATRPEVYALQFMLSMIVCERLMVAFGPEPNSSAGSARNALLTAAFVWGLSLCNHHFLSLLLLPSACVALHRFSFGTGLRSVGLAMLGLLPYAYLPLRAARGPTPNFGEPTDLGRWFWVVSAQAFQKNTGSGVPESFAKRALDVLVVFDAHVSIVGVLTAITAMIVLVRRPSWRSPALALSLVVVTSAAARIWLGHTSNNPDAQGYLVSGLAVTSVFVALLVAWSIQALSGLGRSKKASLRVGLAMSLACSGVIAIGVTQQWSEQDRSQFFDTDSYDDVAFRRAPPEAILILHEPETIFRALEYVSEFKVSTRELLIVPTPFLAYPGMIESLVADEPLLQPVLTHYALDGQWDASQLQSLASSRTLLIEMDPFLPLPVIETLVPSVLFFEVLSSEAYPEDRATALRTHAAGHEHLQRLLGAFPVNSQTRDRLLVHHYQDALYFAAVGQSGAAKEAVAYGLSLNPRARELRALDRTLESKDGPIDIKPFLPPNTR